MNRLPFFRLAVAGSLLAFAGGCASVESSRSAEAQPSLLSDSEKETVDSCFVSAEQTNAAALICLRRAFSREQIRTLLKPQCPGYVTISKTGPLYFCYAPSQFVAFYFDEHNTVCGVLGRGKAFALEEGKVVEVGSWSDPP